MKNFNFSVEPVVKNPREMTTIELKNELGDFEKIIEKWINEPLEYPLEYYGEPVPALGPDYVNNPIMGYEPAGLIQGMIHEKIIAKKGDCWVVLYWNADKNFKNFRQDKGWVWFYRKWKCLQELRSRRNYAQEKEKEAFENL